MEYIWDKRYDSNKYGLETKASFAYFKRYLQQNHPRSIKALHKTLNIERKSQNQNPIKLDTLYKYSHRYKWNMRADSYDVFMREAHFKNKMQLVEDWEKEQLKLAMTRPNYHNDSLNDIHKSEHMDLDKKISAESENQRAYNASIKTVYDLLYGGSVPNKQQSEVKADVHQEVNTDLSSLISDDKLKEILDGE